MAPNWVPLCRSMQVYCEPFFASINNWRAYESEELMRNRIELIQTASSILHNFSQKPDKHEFDLVFENDVELLPEVHPTAGKDYVVDGDQMAFKAAMKTQPKVLFHKGGVYFQDNLLKGIAGWSAEILAITNVETRKTIIASIEKLFRIPEKAGMAHFVYVHIPSTTEYFKRVVVDFPTVTLDYKGEHFFRYLQASRKPGFDFDLDDLNKSHNESAMVVAADPPKKKRARQDEKEDEWEADADGVMWTRKHHSIGSLVAAHFPPLEPQTHLVPLHNETAAQTLAHAASASGSKLFRGRVTKYAPPSSAGLTDQLYHIRWEDGDEQDFDEIDIQRGMDLYDQIEGWTTRHPMVGIRVAAYFPMPVKHSKGGAKEGEMEQVLFCGGVTKFGRALTEDDVALYHVVFDDGDEQDFSEHELQMGIQLYNLEGLTQEEKDKGKSKSTKSASTTTSSNSKKTTESVSPAAKKVKAEPAPSKATTKSNSIAAVLAADRAKQSSATKSTVKTTTSTTPAKVKDKDKGKTKGRPAAKNISSAKKTTAQLLEEVGEEEGADDPVWIMKHDSVFKRVAQHFLVSGGAKKQVFEIFGGTVAVYAPPTSPKARDQLYHIVWDDGDEQDFDELELKAGLALLESIMPTPLYVASADAKALVARKQQELASDFDDSTVISSLSNSNTTTTATTTKMTTPGKSVEVSDISVADISSADADAATSSYGHADHSLVSNHVITTTVDQQDIETQAMDLTGFDLTTTSALQNKHTNPVPVPVVINLTTTSTATAATNVTTISDSPSPRTNHTDNAFSHTQVADESGVVSVDSAEPMLNQVTADVYDLTQGPEDNEGEAEEEEEEEDNEVVSVDGDNKNGNSQTEKDNHSITDSIGDWADTLEMVPGP